MADAVITGSRFVWHELMAKDPKVSTDFFTKLFGWATKEQDMGEMGTYSMLYAGETGIGGIVPLDASQPEIPAHWIAYVSVDSVDDATAKVEGLGGKVVVPPTDIPGTGRFAVIADPCGAHISPFEWAGEPMPEPEGPPVLGTFCWNELLTTDTRKSADFYGGIFGWSSAEFPMGEMGTYNIFRRGEADTAGMMQMPGDAEHPPFWLSYVAVNDVDAAAARVKELGGNIWAGPQDIPDVGRFAVCSDPTGATFAIYKGKAG